MSCASRKEKRTSDETGPLAGEKQKQECLFHKHVGRGKQAVGRGAVIQWKQILKGSTGIGNLKVSIEETIVEHSSIRDYPKLLNTRRVKSLGGARKREG